VGAPGEGGAAQAPRLDEQDAVLARQARHQVMLVGPQLGVPVGEADAHDVAAAEAWGLAHRRHDSRLSSLAAVIHSVRADLQRPRQRPCAWVCGAER
jgi:hypothetical protein